MLIPIEQGLMVFLVSDLFFLDEGYVFLGDKVLL